jgi:hypothetical protein
MSFGGSRSEQKHQESGGAEALYSRSAGATVSPHGRPEDLEIEHSLPAEVVRQADVVQNPSFSDRAPATRASGSRSLYQ